MSTDTLPSARHLARLRRSLAALSGLGKPVTLLLLWAAAALLLFMQIRTQPDPRILGLDSGWFLELENQLRLGRVLGRDTYFTYGPLSQLIMSTGAFLRGSPAVLDGFWTGYFMFDLLAMTLLAGSLALIRPLRAGGTLLIFPVCLLLNGVVSMRQMVLLFATLVLVRTLDTSGKTRYVLSILVGLLWFASQLIATDLGVYALVAGLGFLALCGLLALPPLQSRLSTNLLPWRVYAATGAIAPATLALCNLGLELLFQATAPSYGLFDYLRYNLAILRGYNYTMGIGWSFSPPATLVLFAVFLYITGLVLRSCRDADAPTAHLLAGLLIAALLSFKGALVRSDLGHILFSSAIFVFLFLLLLALPDERHRFPSLGALLLALLVMVWPINGSGLIQLAMSLASGAASPAAHWQGLQDYRIDPRQVAPADLQAAIDPQAELINFPYDNVIAMALDRPSLAPVLQTYSAHDQQLQQKYVHELAAHLPNVEVVYGLDGLGVGAIDGVQNVARVPMIFQYLLEHFRLTSDTLYRGGFALLAPRPQPRPISSRPLAYQAHGDTRTLELALEKPERCPLLQLDITVRYPFAALLGRPNQFVAQVYEGQRLVAESKLVPIEVGKPFSTLLSLGDPARFHHLFGDSYDARLDAYLDRVTIAPALGSLFSVNPSSISVAGLHCIQQVPEPTAQLPHSLVPGTELDLAELLPNTFVGRTALQALPGGLFMHADGALELVPIIAPHGTCFLSRAMIDAEAARHPDADGVDFTVTLRSGTQQISQRTWRVAPGGSAEIAVPVPSGTPMIIRLETGKRGGAAWDWATWEQPRLAACGAAAQ